MFNHPREEEIPESDVDILVTHHPEYATMQNA